MAKSYNTSATTGIYEALKALGWEVTDDEGTEETPERFVGYLEEFWNPDSDPSEVLGGGFNAPREGGGLVVQTDIPFRGVCEHHLLPMFGKAAIGYIPDGRVVGLSKLTRLVHAVGHQRPSIQESMGDRIADILHERLHAKGVIVVLEAEHTCMTIRGVAAPGVTTKTSAVRGVFRDVPAARSEFFSLIGR